MWYALGADLIVAFHVAYVSFVVLGQLAILLGIVLKWRWVRNLWFRLAHLLAIVIVGLEAVWDIACPLTVWEESLRRLAGQEMTGESFIGRSLHRLIFLDCPPWFFNVLHISFALLVLATFILAPPRWRKQAPLSTGITHPSHGRIL
jgi:hypothetical protein